MTAPTKPSDGGRSARQRVPGPPEPPGFPLLHGVSRRTACWLLTTISVTVAKQVQKINVKIIEPSAGASRSPTSRARRRSRTSPGSSGRVIDDARATTSSVAGPEPRRRRSPTCARRTCRASASARRSARSPATSTSRSRSAARGSPGGGPGGGGFGDLLGGLRKVGVDLVLLIDTTDSMQSIIDDVKNEVRGFIAQPAADGAGEPRRRGRLSRQGRRVRHQVGRLQLQDRQGAELRRQSPRRRRRRLPRGGLRGGRRRHDGALVAEDLASHHDHHRQLAAARRDHAGAC